MEASMVAMVDSEAVLVAVALVVALVVAVDPVEGFNL